MSDRPNCLCHDEPQYWHRDPRTPVGGYWICGVTKRATNRRHYLNHREEIRELKRLKYAKNPEKHLERVRRRRENLTGVQYNLTLLQGRRRKARKRMAERKDRLAEDRQEAASG